LTSPAPAFLAVGRIGRAHGVRGEVSVQVLTDFPERFAKGAALFVGPEAATAPVPVRVESARPHHRRLLVRLDIAPDRTAAEGLTGQYLFIPTAEAADLGPGEFYPHELIGLAVAVAGGEDIGAVVEIMETGSADVLIVDGPRGKALIPMIDDVIDSIDLEDGRMTITPMPGLLPWE